MHLNYFRRNEKTEGENPTVSTILFVDNDDSLLEFTTEWLANKILDSKHMLQLLKGNSENLLKMKD